MSSQDKFMKAAVVEGPGKVSVRRFAVPEPQLGEVLIRIESCLLCTWEQRLFSGHSTVKGAIIPGHEASGSIVAVHPDTACNFLEGDRVVFQLRDHCGHCHYCYRGYHNQCTGTVNPREMDGIPTVGGLAQYVALDIRRVYPASRELPYEEAAFAEPLACCIHSIHRADIQFGDHVVVVGAGIMGQLHCMLARLRGARVTVVEPEQRRRETALSLGAHRGINPAVEPPGEWMSGRLDGNGADAILFTAPRVELLEQYIQMIDPMGRIVLYSSFHPDGAVTLSANTVHYSEKVLTGSASPTVSDFYRAVRMLGQKLIPVREFVSASYPLEEVEKAFAHATRPDAWRVEVRLHQE